MFDAYITPNIPKYCLYCQYYLYCLYYWYYQRLLCVDGVAVSQAERLPMVDVVGRILVCVKLACGVRADTGFSIFWEKRRGCVLSQRNTLHRFPWCKTAADGFILHRYEITP